MCALHLACRRDHICNLKLCALKGELNLDKKVAVRWFVLYNNERNSLSFQQILSNFKDIVIYLKNLLTF